METTVFVCISDADEASLTVAEASIELAGVFDTIAVDKVLLETAVVNSDAMSNPSWLESSPAVGAITMSKEMLVDPDRRKRVSACMLVIWSVESILFSDETKAVLITPCATRSLFNTAGSTSSITIAVVTTAGFVGAIVGVCEGAYVGTLVGEKVGECDGACDGTCVGEKVGAAVVGDADGADDGSADG